MDISPPEGPVHSVRAFLSHIATVTCGILIALALEQLVENHRHQVVVRHAEAEFLAEIASNRTKVKSALASDTKIVGTIRMLADYAQTLLKHPRPKPAEPQIGEVNRTFVRLSTSAWETALATQALGWMDFPRARAFSYVYTRQAAMIEFETKTREQWFDLVGFDIDEDLSDQDLHDALRGLRVAGAYADVMQKVEAQLLEAYDMAEAAAKSGN